MKRAQRSAVRKPRAPRSPRACDVAGSATGSIPADTVTATRPGSVSSAGRGEARGGPQGDRATVSFGPPPVPGFYSGTPQPCQIGVDLPAGLDGVEVDPLLVGMSAVA